jgi:hypothetical protein
VPTNFGRWLTPGPLIILIEIVLLIDSEIHRVKTYTSRGIDPFFLIENPKRALERYAGLGLIFVGARQIRMSGKSADDEGGI